MQHTEPRFQNRRPPRAALIVVRSGCGRRCFAVMRNRIRFWILSFDLACIPFGALLAFVTGPHAGPETFWQRFELVLPMVYAALGFWMITFFSLHADGFDSGWQLPAVISKVTVAICCLMAALLSFAFVARQLYSRLFLLRLSLILLAAGLFRRNLRAMAVPRADLAALP